MVTSWITVRKGGCLRELSYALLQKEHSPELIRKINLPKAHVSIGYQQTSE